MNNAVFSIITENERKLPFYLIGVGCRYTQEPIERPEGYPSFQWIQCHGGEGELVIGGKTHRVKQYQGMFLYPDVPHEYYAIKEPWQVDWVTFGGYDTERFIKNMGINESGVFFVSNSESILSKMRRMLAIAQSDSSLKGVECSAIIYDLLLDLMKYTSKSSDDSIQQQVLKLEPVLQFIEQNYFNSISLEEMASVLQVTPQHLCLLFREILNTRPFEYLNNVRINKSKHLMLKDDRMEIGAIARQVGYENTSYFCSVFRKQEGISPGKFRKLYGY